MSSPVLNLIKTTQEKSLFEDELTLLKNALYQDQTHFDEVLLSLRPQIAQTLQTELVHQASKEEYLNNLESELRKMPALGLTLAFEPSTATINKIYDWVTNNIQEPTLIDIDVNPRILGGVIIVSNGEYRDFSVKKIVDKYLLENKDSLLATIKNP